MFNGRGFSKKLSDSQSSSDLNESFSECYRVAALFAEGIYGIAFVFPSAAQRGSLYSPPNWA